MNSPWGLIWSIQKETGWTDDYLLWETSWLNIRMKIADAPYYHYNKSIVKRGKDIETEEELIHFISRQ